MCDSLPGVILFFISLLTNFVQGNFDFVITNLTVKILTNCHFTFRTNIEYQTSNIMIFDVCSVNCLVRWIVRRIGKVGRDVVTQIYISTLICHLVNAADAASQHYMRTEPYFLFLSFLIAAVPSAKSFQMLFLQGWRQSRQVGTVLTLQQNSHVTRTPLYFLHTGVFLPEDTSVFWPKTPGFSFCRFGLPGFAFSRVTTPSSFLWTRNGNDRNHYINPFWWVCKYGPYRWPSDSWKRVRLDLFFIPFPFYFATRGLGSIVRRDWQDWHSLSRSIRSNTLLHVLYNLDSRFRIYLRYQVWVEHLIQDTLQCWSGHLWWDQGWDQSRYIITRTLNPNL